MNRLDREILNIRRFNVEGYHKIKNNHIFINSLSIEVLSLIDLICKIENQKFHIFTNILSDKSIIRTIINKINSRSKVIVYIPRKLNEYARVLEYEYRDIKDKNWKIVIYRKPVKFVNHFDAYEYTNGLEIAYNHSYYRPMYTASTMEFMNFILDEYDVYINIFKFAPYYEHLKLYKKKIIHHFKKYCPRYVLITFKNDEDIWLFIEDAYDKDKVGEI